MRYLYLSITFFIITSLPFGKGWGWVASAQIISTVAGNGTQGYSGDGGLATNAELNYPTGVAFDAAGNMYIADLLNNRIRKVNAAGIISTVAGTGFGAGTVSCTPCYSGDGGQATDAKLNNPGAITLDAAVNLYIADVYNQCIRMVNTAGIINTVAGNGTAGYSGDGGQATNAELHNPDGIAFDGAGNLYIAEGGNSRLRMINTMGIISTVAGNGIQGYSGDGGQATNAELSLPEEVTFDGRGNLYIADYGNDRIRMVNTAGIISTIAGNGTQGDGGDGGQATAASVTAPNGIIFDGAGNLYIADSDSRIRMVNTAGIISTVAGNGTAGFGGDGGQATAAELYLPGLMVFDIDGNIYIPDAGNNKIRKVTNVGQMSIAQLKMQNEELRIYPNPTSNFLNIEDLMVNENGSLVIIDMLSNKLKEFKIQNSKFKIDVSDLNAGVYFLSVETNERTEIKKIIKQ